MATRKTRSKRLALDAKGNDTNDLTQAATGVYIVLAPEGEEMKEIHRVEFAPTAEIGTYERGVAIFGFHTHAGNWANTGWNTLGLEAEDMPEHMALYEQMMQEGGWTNRKGEAEAGAAIFIKAFARRENVDEDRIKAAWEKWSDDEKEAVKSDAGIKAIVAEIRAERAAERAEKAKADGGESKLGQLTY